MHTGFDWLVTSWQISFVVFYMPCFFLISGYCSNFNKERKDFYKGILKQILLPYFTFSIIQYFFGMVEANDYSMSAFLSPILTIPNTALWFLLALAFSKFVVYELINMHSSKRMLILYSLLLMIVGVALSKYRIIPNYFSHQNCFISVFFVAIGHVIKQHENLYKNAKTFCFYAYPGIFLFLYVVTQQYFHKDLPNFSIGIGVSLATIPLFIFLATMGSLFMLRLCEKIKSNAFFEYLGRNSLIIYGAHFRPLKYAILFGLQTDNVYSFIISVVLVYVVVVCICALIITLFNKTRLGVLIGK